MGHFDFGKLQYDQNIKKSRTIKKIKIFKIQYDKVFYIHFSI